MSGRKGGQGGQGGQRQAGVVVTVCRGCCCGTVAQHPGVHHDGQVDQLRRDLAASAQVRVSDCLDACERSNVVVVTPSPAGRRACGRPVWLGEVLDPSSTADIADWASAGGPGLADRPQTLDVHYFRPPRPTRQSAQR